MTNDSTSAPGVDSKSRKERKAMSDEQITIESLCDIISRRRILCDEMEKAGLQPEKYICSIEEIMKKIEQTLKRRERDDR